jgi:hypothetical protein
MELMEVMTECTARNMNCSATKCCQNENLTCFEKDSSWATCIEGCVRGVHPDWDPPELQSPWSCKVLTKKGTANAFDEGTQEHDVDVSDEAKQGHEDNVSDEATQDREEIQPSDDKAREFHAPEDNAASKDSVDAGGCKDLMSEWKDAQASSCEDYADHSLCTSDGQEGRGWDSSWDSLRAQATGGLSAADVCCACGGGSQQDDVWSLHKADWNCRPEKSASSSTNVDTADKQAPDKTTLPKCKDFCDAFPFAEFWTSLEPGLCRCYSGCPNGVSLVGDSYIIHNIIFKQGVDPGVPQAQTQVYSRFGARMEKFGQHGEQRGHEAKNDGEADARSTLAKSMAQKKSGKVDSESASQRNKRANATGADTGRPVPVYVGCYENDGNSRLEIGIKNVTSHECTNHVLDMDFNLFGMEYPGGYEGGRIECKILSEIPSLRKVSDDECGPEDQRIGGDFRLAVYSFQQAGKAQLYIQPNAVALFCFEVVVGSEQPLVQVQKESSSSIFACESHLVVEGTTTQRGSGGGHDHTASWTNVQAFADAWMRVRDDGRYLKHDWTIKVDPDTVFVPARFRTWLGTRAVPENGAYLTTCGQCSSGHGFYGAMEVFSRVAAKKYVENIQRCQEEFQSEVSSWGEDLFAQKCMDLENVECWDDGNGWVLVCDKLCGCDTGCDGDKVAYHPYKNPDDFRHCMQEISR